MTALVAAPAGAHRGIALAVVDGDQARRAVVVDLVRNVGRHLDQEPRDLALQLAGPGMEPRYARIRGLELESLDHRTHPRASTMQGSTDRKRFLVDKPLGNRRAMWVTGVTRGRSLGRLHGRRLRSWLE
jgi:hypothetical protein